jgi:hypothetical protein
METELPFARWVPLHEVLPLLRERMAVNDGGRFILARWDCKYLNLRLDMRTGMVRIEPGQSTSAGGRTP